MQDTPFIAEDSSGEEVRRAFEIALLGVTPRGSSLFHPHPDGSPAAQWILWLNEYFTPLIAPSFVKVYSLAADFRIREIEKADSEFDKALSRNFREGSLQAATSFLEGKTKMRHHPEWQRFVDRVTEGKTPGHVLTLAALQSVLYHLPLASALLAYARFEFQLGIRKSSAGRSREEEDALFLKVLPHVQVAVRQKIDHISGEEVENGTGGLRAI